MSDRELLELAARATEIDISNADWGGGLDGFYWVDLGEVRYWNPLTDDGDAFRLAVKLGLRIFPFASNSEGWTCSAVSDGANMRLADVVATGDTLADTRRAIVRAAAKIGKGM